MALTKEQIKEFKEAEAEAQDSDDFREVAKNIAEAGDKEWAKKTYEKVEEKAKDFSQFVSLANDICEKLGDKDWGKKLYKKAESKAKYFYEINQVAASICEKLGDKEWAIKLYQKAEKKAEEIEISTIT